MRIEWDPDKAATNLRKHGVRFEAAAMVFSDPYALVELDRIEGYEYRWHTIGLADDLTLPACCPCRSFRR